MLRSLITNQSREQTNLLACATSRQIRFLCYAGKFVCTNLASPRATMEKRRRIRFPLRQPARLAGRVLLVEDVAENRQLVQSLLEAIGVEVQCACDGEQGINRALAMMPDLVLMDIHMPVLDGVGATRRLRQAGFQRPIVALTADVIVQAHPDYLAAGFDDCLAKPINRTTFQTMLAKHLPKAEVAQQLTDLPGFAPLAAAFRAGLERRVKKIGAALAHGEVESAIREAHAIKGSAATFTCPETGQCAGQLEAACRTTDKAAIAAALSALHQAYKRDTASDAP